MKPPNQKETIMSRFNPATPTLEARTRTTNAAGGEGYKSSPELELVSTMLTSFVQDKFYESAGGEQARLASVIGQVDPKFAAQAAIYARDTFNMRSISHIAASMIAERASGQPWAKDFFDGIVVRPDDMTEIASFYSKGGKLKLTAAMKKGFASAFNRFDGYQLGRYRAEDKMVSLVDIVNLTRPKADNEETGAALHALVNGTLRQERTFEAKLSGAGQKASSPDEKAAAKKQAWSETVPSMGYMALLKNLRNIMTDADSATLDLALKRLTNEKAVKNSRVLPFRFIIASRELLKTNHPNSQKVVRALSEALDISVSNVPKFEGRTLIALDASSSMRGMYGYAYAQRSGNAPKGGFAQTPPAEIGALFAAILAKSNDADLMLFHGSASYVNVNTLDSTTTITDQIVSKIGGGATNFASVLATANQKYDRIIVLTDCESWMDSNRKQALSQYRSKFNADPHLYMFKLCDYGNLLFPENKVYNVAGFSDKVFDVMQLLESDRQALVNEVRKVKFK